MLKKILLAIGLSLITSSAWATCGAIPLTVKDASNATQNISSATAADGNCKTYIDADTSSQIHTDLTAAVPAGTNLIGKVGIDQTTPGTTNGVQDAATSATGSAPSAKAIYLGANASGATGGLLQGVSQCDQTAIYDGSTNGSTLLKAGVSGRKFRICGWWFGTGGTATNVKLTEGTTVTTPCDTGTANVTPAFQLAANTQSGFNGPFWNGLGTATAADNLCINTSAGNAVQAIVWFTIQ